MHLFRPGMIGSFLYPEAIFRISTDEKVLYLTFDDGPDPDSTPELLDILDRHEVRCIFFCDGRAAEANGDLVELIISKGHRIGNHGYMHYDGWRVSRHKYVDDILRADHIINPGLFRPPFGRMKIGQYRELKKHFKIVLWDLMPYDFDRKFGAERSLKVLKNKIRPGSVIVMHDSPNSSAIEILNEFLVFALSSGYRFELI